MHVGAIGGRQLQKTLLKEGRDVFGSTRRFGQRLQRSDAARLRAGWIEDYANDDLQPVEMLRGHQPYRAGVFDFFETVFTTADEGVYRPFMVKADGGAYKRYSDWRTHQMSDHLPMWVELHMDFGDAYLEEVERELGALGSRS